jgi:Ribonuclease G/E
VTNHDREPGDPGADPTSAIDTTSAVDPSPPSERRPHGGRKPSGDPARPVERPRDDDTDRDTDTSAPPSPRSRRDQPRRRSRIRTGRAPVRSGDEAAPGSAAGAPAPGAAEQSGAGDGGEPNPTTGTDAGGGRTTQADDDRGDGGRRRRRGRRGRGRGRGGRGQDRGGDRGANGAAEGSTPDDDAAMSPDAEAASTPAADAGEPTSDRDGSARADGSSSPSRRGAASRSRRRRPGRATGDAQPSAAAEDDDRSASAALEPEETPDADGAGAPGDASVERAIARRGTRVAAKRGRRASASGNGGRRSQPRPGGVPEEVRRAILEGPPRTMLVTAKQDRTQIAVLEDRTVVEHYVTRKQDVTFVGNIYMARVQNVLPGMEAAFLDIGKGRNGVLYAGEVLYDELDLEEGAEERIENALKPGQKVLVQVTKDPMGTKGPRLTMHLSLAGRYMVLAPSSDLFGISRKLTDRERDRLRRVVKDVKPDEHGLIVRTAAEGATDEQLRADLERLLAKWGRVEDAAKDAKALTTVYEEPKLVVKVIRDNFGPEFERCIVDDETLYHEVRGYLDEVAPELLDKVELYGQPTLDARARSVGAPDAAAGADGGASGTAGNGEVPAAEDTTTDAAADAAATGDGAGSAGGVTGEGDDDGSASAAAEPAPGGGLTAAALTAARERQHELPPLFDAYDVTDQLRKAMGKKVWLPSGGYLVIEATEAMKVIDVNTGKFTGGKDTNLEEVVLKTNLEAADEIVRQLRLRDMGGIIIIDFIDMLLKANQDQVVRRLKRELLRDRTKTRVSEVSRLGLVQMTRKNVSQGLIESFSHSCDACDGRGIISELD